MVDLVVALLFAKLTMALRVKQRYQIPEQGGPITSFLLTFHPEKIIFLKFLEPLKSLFLSNNFLKRVRFVFFMNHTLVLGSGRKDVLCVLAKGLHGYLFLSLSLSSWSCCNNVYSTEISSNLGRFPMEIMKKFPR